ncbi:MAG: histidine phosphatase family protein [Oscillospiraceae bacterium]
MEIYLIRHGQTEGNFKRRYIGSTDDPLRAEGEKFVSEKRPGFVPEKLFVTPLKRTKQTAELLFSGMEQIQIDDLREMDFGEFENKSVSDLENNEHYAQWLETNCEGTCPGGESKEQFAKRCCTAFEKQIEALVKDGVRSAAFVVHGGTIMAVMAGFASPHKDYFEWTADNCCGYHCRLNGDSFSKNKSMELVESL